MVKGEYFLKDCAKIYHASLSVKHCENVVKKIF